MQGFSINHPRTDRLHHRGYAEIALSHYHSAGNHMEKLLSAPCVDVADADCVQRDSVISVTFAVMCLESYLNYYAGVCREEDDLFDKLSLVERFQLISKVFLKKDVDKASSPYRDLKKLLDDYNRFKYDQNRRYPEEKPDAFAPGNPFPLMNYEEIGMEFWDDIVLHGPQDAARFWKLERDCLDSAENGIKAIRSTALYFREFDSAAADMLRLVDEMSCAEKDAAEARNGHNHRNNPGITQDVPPVDPFDDFMSDTFVSDINHEISDEMPDSDFDWFGPSEDMFSKFEPGNTPRSTFSSAFDRQAAEERARYRQTAMQDAEQFFANTEGMAFIKTEADRRKAIDEFVRLRMQSYDIRKEMEGNQK